jgi:energy-converting hydrogenase Eha subunit A
MTKQDQPRRKRWLPAIIIATLVVTIGAAVAGNTWTDGADQPTTITTP